MRQASKTGVLLVNLGTPKTYKRWDVYKYLKEFLLDKRVIDVNPVLRNFLVRCIIAPFRSKSSAQTYKEIWLDEGSPLLVYSQRFAHKLQDQLGDGYEVALSMRYQQPSIQEGLEQLRNAAVEKIIVLPMFPQYASATIGSVQEKVMEIISRWEIIPDISFISKYEAQPDMIKAFAELGQQYDPSSFDHILFSYHGLPERQIKKGDYYNVCQLSDECCKNRGAENAYCYRANCFATTEAIANELNITEERYTVCFQSRLGNDPWVKPYTVEVVKDLAEKGYKRLLVFCPAFVSDCLETIYEIGIEYDEDFREMGGEKVQLVDSLNDHDLWVQGAKKLIEGQGT